MKHPDKDTVFNFVKAAAKDSLFELIPTIRKAIALSTW
jgi:hypothetical protein